MNHISGWSFRSIAACSIALAVAMGTSPASAQTLEVAVTANGAAAKPQPLPVGATASLTIVVRNEGARDIGPVVLSAQTGGLLVADEQDWRFEESRAVVEISRLAAGARAERPLRLTVARALFDPVERRIRIEARSADETAAAETSISIADCVGAYRERLRPLRAGLTQAVRDAADELRKSDPALPAGRLFPATGARGGELRNAERLAASFAARRGGDAEMATEWFRYMIARWVLELNAFASQPPNPGLCANNYYQIAGYRQGLLPITKRIDSIREAAASALAAAREADGADANEDIASLVRRLLKEGTAESAAEDLAIFPALSEARKTFARGRRLSPEEQRKFSLAETAAWLDDANRRGRKLAEAIERILSAVTVAHRKSCLCAY